MRTPRTCALLVACLVVSSSLSSFGGAPATPIRIQVAASKGQVIPQSRGGGGFQRNLRFTALPGRAGGWIRQALEVRGTVFDVNGRTKPVHLDVVEYYRVGRGGAAISPDTHYSQFFAARGGKLVITATLTYGALESKKRGDTIVSKSFVLRGATDENGKHVAMKTRTRPRQVIHAERGKRVAFITDPGSIPTKYTYGVRWDTRPGFGSRTQPSGAIDVGTWWSVLPKQEGHTKASATPRPIPRLK